MAEKNPAKPVDSTLSDEEESLNQLLAAVLREELARRRSNSIPLGLPNSRSESSLSEDRRLPDYLTGFRIPTLTASTASSQSSNGSLQGAFRNLNFNQGEGSTTNSQNSDGKSEENMETDTNPGPSTSGTNPFQEQPKPDNQAAQVSPQISSDFETIFFDSLETTSQFFDISTASHNTAKKTKSVDSLKKILFHKEKSLSSVASESDLPKTTPIKPRRSSRLLSKGENLGVIKSGPQGKNYKSSKEKIRASKLKLLSNLYKLPSPGLTQLLDDFSPILPPKGKTTGKRAPEGSPELIQPSKQLRTESRIQKQSQAFSSPPLPQRDRLRSRPRKAHESNLESDVSRKGSHAQTTPPAQSKQKQKQTHMANTCGGATETGLEPSDTHGEALIDDLISTVNAWPSTDTLSQFTSDLSPPILSPIQRQPREGLNLSDILNENADPSLAVNLLNVKSHESIHSDLSDTDKSEASVALVELYPPRTLRGKGVLSNPSLQTLTGLDRDKPKNNKKIPPNGQSPDPITALVNLCNDTEFTKNGASPAQLPAVPAPNNSKTNSGNIEPTRARPSTLPLLLTWDCYLKSLDSNPFSKHDHSAQTPFVVDTNSTNKTHITNKSNTFQHKQGEEMIFKDALGVWRELRNALTRDVVLRLRLKNIQTMLADNLVPKWSVTYSPPSSLLTTQNQIDHVVDVRRQIFRTQLECTKFLTQREIEALEQKIKDLKDSLQALYKTPKGKKHDYQAALNQAVILADRQRRSTFDELNKRLMAIRQAPEEALMQGLPTFAPDTSDGDNNDDDPQPSTSSGITGPNNQSRSRSTQRWAQNQQGQGQKRPKSRSQSNPRQQDVQPGSNQNGWVKVSYKKQKGKGKGKGKGKSSNNAQNQNQRNRRNEDQDEKEELYNLLAAFFSKNKKKNGRK